jgi:transcription antitermination factor NusA-like protein
MLCELCHKNVATVHLTHKNRGQEAKKIHLCEGCFPAGKMSDHDTANAAAKLFREGLPDEPEDLKLKVDANASNTEPVWTALRKHVPEVTSGLVKIMEIMREPGHSVVVVTSNDPRGDPVGTVVGHMGERVKRMVSELGGEKIDIIRWDESAERFIANVLAPLRLIQVSFDDAKREARAIAMQPSSSRPPPLTLRSEILMRLTGWKLHIEVKYEG